MPTQGQDDCQTILAAYMSDCTCYKPPFSYKSRGMGEPSKKKNGDLARSRLLLHWDVDAEQRKSLEAILTSQGLGRESRVVVLVDCDNTMPEILGYAIRVVAQFGRVVLAARLRTNVRPIKRISIYSSLLMASTEIRVPARPS